MDNHHSDTESEQAWRDRVPTPHVLLVDDNGKNLTAIESVLSDLGVNTTSASSGREALRCLLQQDFTLVLLDVKMPDVDGFETARLIRARTRTRHLPIIFITGYSPDDASVRRAYALGAVDYLLKPIVPEVLRAKVQVFVELHARAAMMMMQAQQLREAERLADRRALQEERQRWEAAALRREMAEQCRINARLEELDRRKNEFIALLAHELRNPLVPIVTGIEMLRLSGAQDETSLAARDAIARQAYHLERLVNDLVDVSRLSHNKLKLKRDVIILTDVVTKAVSMSESTLLEHGQTIALEGPNEPILLYADPVRCTQILTNLLNNAARYSPPGKTVTVRWGKDSQWAYIRVLDQGCGIDPTFMGRIFDMFEQDRASEHGLGLGLTLVKQLVELHEGVVEAHSEGRGRGSELVVRIPALQACPLPPRVPAAVAPALPRPQGVRVAVVEDDPDVREGLAALITTWGHDVVAAHDGPTGVQLVVDERPEVVFLDVGLPGLDGFEVAQRIRASMGAECPKLVAMTGYGQEEDRRRARAAGFDVHLVKPSEPELMREIIEESRLPGAPEPTPTCPQPFPQL